MLAYVFWHLPAAGAADYEARLAAFHAALRGAGVPWLGPTATYALESVPWLGGAAGYEDWYLVDDFAALGALNHAAVSGARRDPHDAAAALAGTGAGGVLGHVAGPWLPPAAGWAAWLAKPDGMAYETFHAALAAAVADGAAVWQRQMVLGPAPEFCVLAAAPQALPWPAQGWGLRTVVDQQR